MNKILAAINRAYARPPLSWVLAIFLRIRDVVAVPFRPLIRWHARRRQAELVSLVPLLARAGLRRQADQVAVVADRWGEVAKVGRHRAQP